MKTAGTTWLEEIAVLSASGEEGFQFALELYAQALDRFEELTDPYPDVLDINREQLPQVEQLQELGKEGMSSALSHNPDEKDFNPHFRQLMHCAYKIAAEQRQEFFKLMQLYRKPIEKKVTENLFEKHIRPIFLIS